MFKKKDMVKIENDPDLEVGTDFHVSRLETEKFFRIGLEVLKGHKLEDQLASLKKE